MVNESNIILEPMDLSIGRREKNTILCVADVASSLNDTYFTLGTAGSAVATHYVWQNVAAAGVDPAIAGLIGVEVSYAEAASAVVVAAANQVAIEAITGFNTKVSGSTVTVENSVIGLGFAEDTGVTGFTITNAAIGVRAELGATTGGVEFTPNVSVVEVTADQLGASVLDEIQNGVTTTISTTIQEMTAENWSTIIGTMAGDEVTPDGGTKLVGYGESKLFKNMTAYSYELLMKPSNSSDDLRNMTLWKAYALPGAINYSGTDLQGLAVEFKVFRDTSRNAAVDIACFGDSSQNTLV